MHLIDEQHAVAGRLYLVNDLLKTFLELAAVLGPRHEGTHVQRDKPLTLQGLRDFSAANALGQGLYDGGLANPWLTHQDRVVLGTAAKYLYHPLDFLFPSHNRVELIGPGCHRQVNAQLVESRSTGRGARALRASACAVAQNAVGLRPYFVEGHAQAFQHPGGDAFSFTEQANQQVFGPDVGVVHPPSLVDGQLHHLFRAGSQSDLPLGRFLAAPNDKLNRRTDFAEIHCQAGQDPSGNALSLPYQAQQNMLGPNIVVVESLGFFLGQRQNPAGSLGEFLKPTSHNNRS